MVSGKSRTHLGFIKGRRSLLSSLLALVRALTFPLFNCGSPSDQFKLTEGFSAYKFLKRELRSPFSSPNLPFSGKGDSLVSHSLSPHITLFSISSVSLVVISLPVSISLSL